MRTKQKVITLKLTPTEIQELHRLVATGPHKSVSAVIREGLGLMFAQAGVSAEAMQRMRSERRIHAPRHGKVRRLPMTD